MFPPQCSPEASVEQADSTKRSAIAIIVRTTDSLPRGTPAVRPFESISPGAGELDQKRLPIHLAMSITAIAWLAGCSKLSWPVKWSWV
jgi:hypothetical protein